MNSLNILVSNSQSHLIINPSVSMEVSVKFTCNGAKLLLLSTLKEAIGGLLAGGPKTSICIVFWAVFLFEPSANPLSVTVSVTS